MDYLILGLLTLSSMTGYEVQQFIRQNLSLICSHSAGSVQTALSKLCQSGKITAEEKTEGKRRKKIFSITDAGRRDFENWIAQPMRAEKNKNMELSRLFFLGLADPQARADAIRAYIAQMTEMKAVLLAIEKHFFEVQEVQKENLPAGVDWEQVFRFQKYTVDYGIAAAEFEQNWYSHLLRELEEEK